MENIKTGPKDFFLWTGAMIALYASVFSLLALFFNYIDIAYPDALTTYIDPYSSGIRFAIASLLVLFPIYLILIRLIRRDIAAVPEKKGIWIRRWALMLTIFVAGVTMAGDLIALVNTFLGGEITTHFVLKVLVVLLVMAGGLMHFLAELWGYWDANPRYAMFVAAAVSALVLITIVAGFIISGTPSQMRLYRFDDQKVSDLQNLQSQVLNYWQTEGSLPPALSSVLDPLNSYGSIPKDPQTNLPYEYATSSTYSFKLCADFNAETQPNSPTGYSYMMSLPEAAAGAPGASNDVWYHEKGRTCFVRTIDPKRYPVNKPSEPAAAPAPAK